MSHLEEKKIVHRYTNNGDSLLVRDLALRNLLVGTFGEEGSYVVKISDFVSSVKVNDIDRD